MNQNIKDIVTARFQNPKFIYDGKRMRSFATRKVVDYTSAMIYERFIVSPPPLQPGSENAHEIMHLKTPELSANKLSEILPIQCAHVSINKIKCPINVVEWTPDGRRCITGSGTGEFTLWNGFGFNFETILQAHESAIRSLCWSPSGAFLISADTLGLIKYWNPSMNNIQMIQAHGEAIRDLSFAYGDAKFCSASDDGKIKIWDSLDAREECALSGHGWDVRVAKWHSTKALIASGGKDNLVKLWDPRGGCELRTLHIHKNTILALQWADDYLLTGGKDQTVKMVDLRMMKEVFTYRNAKREIASLCTHPFKKDLFVSGTADGVLNFWQMFNSEPVEVVENAHDAIVWSIKFHPVGHTMATGSSDQSCRFWIRPRPWEKEEIDEEESGQEFEENIPGL
ncbi:Flowering time control protein FY [Astathelohania contejeani]|uniref:Polyadenylation factor subunit 2 n=1 Tax=Astathelohania contejeani TaxID=164912 RepID=A0ABQ7HXG0_9MICR|nr:Flowering time control protein FY [Thelohania contejeani]